MLNRAHRILLPLFHQPEISGLGHEILLDLGGIQRCDAHILLFPPPRDERPLSRGDWRAVWEADFRQGISYVWMRMHKTSAWDCDAKEVGRERHPCGTWCWGEAVGELDSYPEKDRVVRVVWKCKKYHCLSKVDRDEPVMTLNFDWMTSQAATFTLPPMSCTKKRKHRDGHDNSPSREVEYFVVYLCEN